jgi:hypothetical protein
MKGIMKGVAMTVIALIAVSGLAAAHLQEASDPAKIYADITGDYRFVFEDQSTTIKFWVENGRLYAAPKGRDSELAEVIPVDLISLKFEALTNDEFWSIVFIRDDSGKIMKCRMTAQGTELEGVRILK